MKVKKSGSFVEIGAAAGSDAVSGGASTSPPTHVGSQGVGSSVANGSVTVNVPAGTLAGDVMIVNMQLQSSSDVPTTPSGWTPLYDVSSGSPSSFRRMAGFWKIASASEPSSYTFTVSNGSHNLTAAITVYRNAGTPVLVGTVIDGGGFNAATVLNGTVVMGVAGQNTGAGIGAAGGATSLADVRPASGINLLVEANVATSDTTITPVASSGALIATTAVVTVPPAPGSATLRLTDANKVLEMANPATATVTIPDDSIAIPVGSFVTIRRRGLGLLNIAAAGGVTYNGPATIPAQYDEVWLHKRAANSWHGVYFPGVEKGVANGIASLDGTGKVPAGQLPPGSPGSLLGHTEYQRGTDGTVAAITSTVLADVDATNLKVDFVAPASGQVIVKLSCPGYSTAANQGWYGLREGTTDFALAFIGGAADMDSHTAEFFISGLTPGSAHTFKWAAKVNSGTFNMLGGPTYGRAIMEVYAVGSAVADSNLQTIIDAVSAIGQNTQTASYTLVLADAGKVVEMDVATANNLTIPLNSSVAFPVGTVIELWQKGAGQVTIVPTGGVTLRSPGGLTKLYGQYSGGTLRKRATDEWVLQGDLA